MPDRRAGDGEVTREADTANASASLYCNDYSLGTDRMTAALTALGGTHTTTVATSTGDFVTQLTGGGYDSAFAAIGTFHAGGGAAIADDWTRNITHVPAFGTTFTGATNQTQFNRH